MPNLGELFNINYGQREYTNKQSLKSGNNILISSQEFDYGCYGFFNISSNYKPPLITVPRTGSIGQSFVQEYDCSVDDNCLVLIPKKDKKIDICELYFIAACIRKESWRFRYGRQVTPNRIANLEINFKYYDKVKILKERTKIINSYKNIWNFKVVSFNDKKRKDKKYLEELFEIDYGQHELNSKSEIEIGKNIIISSQGIDNGCYGFYNIQKDN